MADRPGPSEAVQDQRSSSGWPWGWRSQAAASVSHAGTAAAVPAGTWEEAGSQGGSQGGWGIAWPTEVRTGSGQAALASLQMITLSRHNTVNHTLSPDSVPRLVYDAWKFGINRECALEAGVTSVAYLHAGAIPQTCLPPRHRAPSPHRPARQATRWARH